MKIIQIDNFGKESVSDILIARDVNDTYVKMITMFLNQSFSGIHSDLYFRAVGDDYKLYKYKP